ncbi:hypothetical protein P152DRAFT_101062 [Eremomyces bilateralis CBS 781.70]|uniref:Plastocyanin-like domain-containing protein n=1 Tax=Eremomyces bilateralis CBS 781.70 TaxID=1392243 RepID=A0A6G1FWV1_9PEZI|nr:uncharacterized protein P152DRAFT_101062 [Eremomyces bilateralis CBS 781.70]KAF1810160.1 hypothetical protein P152DRAFT_101062 [Eremomyces bilateralis CBS 781.70]
MDSQWQLAQTSVGLVPGKLSRYPQRFGSCTVTEANIFQYFFDIMEMAMALVGVSRMVQVVNGQFQSPAIEPNWGDTIEATDKSSLLLNDTGMHWHGMRQFRTSRMDGANELIKCPIVPGESKTYTSEVTQYGT